MVAVLLASPAAWAGVIQPSPYLPPELGEYVALQHATYPQDVILRDSSHQRFLNIVRTPDGADELEEFDSTLLGTADVIGFMNDIPIMLTGPVVVRVSNYTSGDTGTFDTEILSMSLVGTVGGIPVEVRESPTLDSLGETTITEVVLGGIAEIGGLPAWEIESYFDVYTELSVQG
ncbi:hypothetical protein LCGC14_2798010, partial [marine sediment metagenome]